MKLVDILCFILSICSISTIFIYLLIFFIYVLNKIYLFIPSINYVNSICIDYKFLYGIIYDSLPVIAFTTLMILCLNFCIACILIMVFLFVGHKAKNVLCDMAEIYIYFRYVCHTKTLLILYSFLNIDINVKFILILLSFIIISNIYDFISSYSSLSYYYKHTSKQFCEDDMLVKYQILQKLIRIQSCNIISNHVILLDDSTNIIDVLNKKSYFYDIIQYYSEIIDRNILYDLSVLLYIEVMSFTIYVLLTKNYTKIIFKLIARVKIIK